MAMSYGPLWAVMSALIALIAWNHAIVMGLLFKILIAAAWIWALILIDKLLCDRPVRERCLAIPLFGWVPLSVSQSIAEGHNDIVMMAPALLWLLLLQRKNAAAPIALAASVLCKYVTAPLFLIDLIHAFRRERLSPLPYVRRMLLPALLAILSLALFFRSIAFFDGVRLVSEWHFLRPSEAVSGLEQVLGMSLYPLHIVALAVFPVNAVYWLAIAVREPAAQNLTTAAVALIAAITFGAISHLWPWYLVWGMAFGALLPRWWVSRFLTGVALLIPFALATWWIPTLEPLQNIVALAIYAGAGLWVYLTRERPLTASQ
jgi:alpha-1,6-mannosyltransferase